MIFVITDDDTNLVYNIRVVKPSWILTKYILDNFSKVDNPEDPRHAQDLKELNDTICKECVKGWCYEGETEMKTDWAELPGNIVNSVGLKLIEMSQKIATVQVKTEKN